MPKTGSRCCARIFTGGVAKTLLFAGCVASSSAAWATNGFNLIGFGAESTLMAGADVAVSRDTGALNTNPAGLTQISGQMFDGFASMLRTFDLAHKDSFGNDHRADNRYTFLGGGGYAQSLENAPCTVGVGLFAQGGAGGVYEDINTAFGNKDDLSSLFAIAKVIPGFGCKVNDKLSLGASMALVYAGIEQKLFDDTSVAAANFAGYELKDASAVRFGFKAGMQYRLTDSLTFGAAYTEKTELPLTGGSLVADFTDFGLGKVKYSNARVKGFALPREVALGLAFKPSEDWLVSFKLNWINWADAVETITLRATDPGNALAPAAYELVSPQDWHNQWVIATGVAYNWNDKTTLYAGHNYGKSPIPERNASPLLAGILEHHVTVGAARKINQDWIMTGGLEYMVPVKANYTSPLFGEAEVRNEAVFVHVMLSRHW